MTNPLDTVSVPEKKRKNGNGKHVKQVPTWDVMPGEPVTVAHVTAPKVDPSFSQERYVEYLEDRVQKLEWEMKHTDIESTTRREKERIRKLEHFLYRIQNAPFDDTARELLETIRVEELGRKK
jgi:hypothetical protein